ncbi:MAG: hypothetical protein ACF8R7_03060 [Phycisphaerales bacterium JB039]
MLDQAEPAQSVDKPASEMTTIEIVQELETVTSRIEAERVREREARAKYKVVADEVERRVNEIRDRANMLVREQRRRLESFTGLVGNKADAQVEPLPSSEPRQTSGRSPQGSNGAARRRRAGRRSIADAILDVWTLDRYSEPLTTDEIIEALDVVGYESSASPRSLKSSLNQALARLCKDGKVQRYRLDGDPIPPSDTVSRARRYMPAPDAIPEEELID